MKRGFRKETVGVAMAILSAAFSNSVMSTEENPAMKAPASQMDNILRKINRTRPAITVFCYPGHPSYYAHHRSMSDVERIVGYFDPVVGIDFFGFNPKPGIKGAPQDAKAVSKALEANLKGFEQYDAYAMVHTQGMVTCGHPAFPEQWLPEGASRAEYDDRAPNSNTPGRLALANPKLYEDYVFPTIETYLGGMKDTRRAALFWCESEPGSWDDYETFRTTGNPHTIALFQKFLSEEYHNQIADFNKAAGTDYTSFAEVKPSDDNWLVRIKVAHFGSYLLYSFYQGKTVEAYQRTFPNVPIATRWCELVGGGPLDPRDGSRFDSVKADYVAHTWYLGNPFVPYSHNDLLLGKVTSNGSFLQNYNRPICWGETGMWRDQKTQELQPYIRPMTPAELRNLVYRSLHYNLGLLMLFNWTFPLDNVGWSSHAHYPDVLRAAQETINELERIKPYASFGDRQPPPVGIIITRNAAGFPLTPKIDQNGHFYNDVAHASARIAENPRASHFDLIEEHSGLSLEKLTRYKGLIVYDAALSAETRGIIGRLATQGMKLLIIGPNRYLDERYLPTPLPAAYPVSEIGRQLGDLTAKIGNHPILAGLKEIRLTGPSAVTIRTGKPILKAPSGEALGAAGDNVVYISGVPMDIDQRRQLYVNFTLWCSRSAPDLYLSRWEDAIVAQNYRSDKMDIRVDGHLKSAYPWFGHIDTTLARGDRQQLWERRGDFPWLAFEDGATGRRIEGVFIDSTEVRVYMNEVGPLHPHFEGVPDTLGFHNFVLGTTLLRGSAVVRIKGKQTLHFVRGFWPDTKLTWQVHDMDARKTVARGGGAAISFNADPAAHYDIVVQREKE